MTATKPTPDEVAALAYPKPCPTTTCKAVTGTWCVTSSGKKAAALHPERLGRGEGTLSQQAEVDTLTSQIATLTTQLATAQAGAALVPALQDQVNALQRQLADLQAQLVAYQASHPDAPPVVTVPAWVRPTGPGTVRYEDLPGATLQARLNASKTRALVTLAGDTFEQADFVQPPSSGGPYGLVLGTQCAGIAGSDVDKTILQLKAMSSTKVGNIKKQSTGYAGPSSPGSTNPYKVLHVSGDCALSGFTLRGTDQPTYTVVDTPPDPQTGRGHNYNGIEVYQGGKVTIGPLKVEGIPGSNSANPGETFSLMIGGGAALDLNVVDFEVDGRHPDTGKPISGSGIYHGGTIPKSVHTDTYVHHMGYGWGYTHYDVSGGKSTYTRARSRFNPGAFNWERCANHTFDLVQCDNQGTRAIAKPAAGFGAQPIFGVVDSDKGSVVINLRDVKIDDGTGTLVTPSAQHPVLMVIHPSYWGPNKQKASDIHIFDAAGLEHPDWLVVLTGYQLDGKAA